MPLKVHKLLQSQLQPSSLLLPWLTCTDSLSEKLKQSTGEAKLNIMRQHWDNCGWWEKNILGLENTATFKREILMSAQNRECWYAKTFIPDSTYMANEALFEQLKSNSLANILFSAKPIVRVQHHYYSINATCLEYHWLQAFDVNIDEKWLWVRLAEFSVNNKYSFFLIEILLPGLKKYML